MVQLQTQPSDNAPKMTQTIYFDEQIYALPKALSMLY